MSGKKSISKYAEILTQTSPIMLLKRVIDVVEDRFKYSQKRQMDRIGDLTERCNRNNVDQIKSKTTTTTGIHISYDKETKTPDLTIGTKDETEVEIKYKK